MTISVVQTKTFTNGTSGSLTSSVTTGNSIILWIFGYNTTSTTITSSSPQYNGASVTGATQFFQLQSSGTNTMYTSIWLLPNVASSGTSLSFTLTGSNIDANQGWAAAEVSGLGASPSLDSGASPNPSTGSGVNTSNPSSGATGNITSAPELIVGGFMTDGSPTGPGSPWTTMAPNGFCSAGYQVVTSSGSSYTYSGTSGNTDWSAGVAAIQVAAAGGVTYVPQRYGQAAPLSMAPWEQRPYRSVPGTADTPATPLPAPLDVSWQADGRYSHLYNDTAARDRRAYFTQRNYVSDPLLLTTAELENELLGGGDYSRQFLAATHYDRREVPQQPQRLADPVLITTAQLENELLGSADDLARHRAWYADRREVPQQRQYYLPPSPFLLENELLGGAETIWHAWWWRPGSWPQQRAYISDPSFYPAGAVTDPLTVAWGTGGNCWHLYNRAADITDRREYFTQRLYQSDPLLLLSALLENELLGGADTARHYAWFTDRREVPQQRPYISDPSFYPSAAATDPLTLAWGAGGPYWHLYNRAGGIADRREVPQQRAYVSPPGMLATALLENELLGSADDLARHRAWYSDRREVPAQRPGTSLPDIPADPLILGDDRARHLLAAGYWPRGWSWFQRQFFPVPEPPPPVVPPVFGTAIAGDGTVPSAASGTGTVPRAQDAQAPAARAQQGTYP